MTEVNFSEWMSVHEAAGTLGIAVPSVYRAARKMHLSGRKSPFGGMMISRRSVEDYRRNRLGRRGRPPISEK